MHQCACNFHELFLLTHAINHTIVHAPSYLMIPRAVGGRQGGREPGRIGGRKGTGDAREKGGKREFKDGGMRE